MKEDATAAAKRKKDHIELAFQSKMLPEDIDKRFDYEPMLGHHTPGEPEVISFLDKALRLPIWVSSMTGGTEKAGTINHNLARVCHDFGMGMGLGSCRALLYSQEHFNDFNVRHLIGDDLPLYGNLGIAQIEELLTGGDYDPITRLIESLRLDGLIVHVNPLQEALQPEGDRLKADPIDSIRRLLDALSCNIIVKEVGQGMGPASLEALFRLPLKAVDFGASGGTNFALLEVMRNDQAYDLQPLAHTGHTASEMVEITNDLITKLGDDMLCKEVIISGGISNFLDGYYLMNRLQLSCVYGQASSFLKHAMGDYDALYHYVDIQAKGLSLAKSFLRVK